MPTHSAFFYGTLMAPPILHRVLYSTPTPSPTQTSRLKTRPALLKGYIRKKVRGCEYPAIIPEANPRREEPDSRGEPKEREEEKEEENGEGKEEEEEEACSVRGMYVEGLTDGDIWRLDIFEGGEYERVKVWCRILDEEGEGHGHGDRGEEVQAETYVWRVGEEGLEAGEWDFETFRRERMGRWVGGSGREDFEEVDEAVRRGKDPMGGRGEGGCIGEMLQGAREKEGEVLQSAV